MKKQLFAFAAALALMNVAQAQVSVTAPWVRATVPQQRSSAVFMHLLSARDARLVEVRTPVAAVAELHKMEMNGDRMKMEQVEGIDLPAGKGVNLASGGYHIMLMGLKRQLKDGDVVPVTIVVEGRDKKRETMTLDVPVKPLAFQGQAAAPALHH
ncbi:MAG: copper chaperone PCu(A)C [Telluria sp.]